MESYKSSGQIAGYVARLMAAFEPDSQAGLVLARWLRHRSGLTGVEFLKVTTVKTASGKRRKAKSEDKPLSPRAWAQLCDALAKAERGTVDSIRIPASNLQAFSDAMTLEPLEREILAFVFQCGCEGAFDMLCDHLVATRMIDSAGVIAVAIGKSQTEVWRCLRSGALRKLGLIEGSGTGTSQFCFYVPYSLRRALLPPNDGIEEIERALLGNALWSDLLWSDFEHLALQRDFMADLLAGAASTNRRGINILLYGPPGTGKTELCKILAASAGLSLFAIGECDEDGDEPDRYGRLADLRLAQRLAMRRGEAALLFDEMEDILQNDIRAGYDGSRMRRAGSKVFLNRTLEENPVPILWTANSVQEFDPAFLRRMSCIVEVKVPPLATRKRLWEKALQLHGVSVERDAPSVLSRRHRVGPGVINTATRSVAVARGGEADLDFVVGSLSKLVDGSSGYRPILQKPSVFQPELVNADLELASLEQALSHHSTPRDFSLCCHGAPGTGKSAFVRHLAQTMGLDVLEKRGSDLLSKWVGETEQLIAEAFAEAREDERFLIIDEADSLLWGRSGANRSWEVSMVNELLQAMEGHQQPFACTTNQIAQIDAAALRRFTFKIKFDFMTAPQVRAAFRSFFGEEAPATIERIACLTPGDFAVVAKKLKFLRAAAPDGVSKVFEIQRLLEQEVAVKPATNRKIGFTTTPRT
ncbi:AAA family ATPase [Pelagibius sp. Alg239-R121]|uniref:AAA family ATPase n=1 Tax=Pelagibius sp. Alg239-R121 TaxID=2993448 RepID=UPI0024A68390|nr:AAA family ATPase [Pelagibius sp. Alg239-R121]